MEEKERMKRGQGSGGGGGMWVVVVVVVVCGDDEVYMEGDGEADYWALVGEWD